MSRRPGDGRPPSLAGALLDLLEGSGAPGTLRGDLDEEFARHIRPERGDRGGRRWYWRQTLASAPRLVVGRIARGGRRPGEWSRRRLDDLRHAMRSLARRPATTAASVMTLALALGVNTSAFSVVYSVLLRPLPFGEEERLVRIHPDELFYIQLAGAQRFAERTAAFDYVVPWGRTLFTFTGDQEAEEARGAVVQWNHFDMLGVRAELGRTFRVEDARVWPSEVVVLSHALWVRRFGGDPAVVGARVEVGGRTRTIIGVLGADHVPMEPDWLVWAPLPLNPEAGAGSALALNARMRPGLSIEQATQDTRETLRGMWTDDGSGATDEELAAVRVIPLRQQLLGDVQRPLWVLMGAVAGILLLACANVANLLLVQGDARAAEIAVRLSLGATRARVALLLLTETAVMALLGGAVGLVLTWVFLGWVSTHLPPDLPRGATVQMGGAVFLFAVLSLSVAAVLATVAPVHAATREGLQPTLAGGGRGRAPRRGRAPAILVTVEVAVAVVVVVGAGLMLRSLHAFGSVDPGFDPDGVVAVRVTPPVGRYEGDGAIGQLYETLRSRVVALPDVSSAGAVMFLPMTSGGAWTRFRSDPLPPADGGSSASFRVVTPGYFETLRVPLLRGRTFNEGDVAEAQPVVVINATMARDFFPGEDPVGKLLYSGDDASNPRLVIGVVADVRQTDLREPSFPEVYLPLSQSPFERMYVVARAAGDERRALAAVQEAVREVDAGLILSRSAVVKDVVASTMADTRLLAQLLTLFSLVALGLGAVGVYGVTAHRVARSRRDIGVRLALGAERSRVASQVVGRGMIPVAVGLVVGIGVSLLAARAMAGLLFGVPSNDALTLAAVSGLLAGTALLSLALPATWASRVDPATTLREE